MTPEELIVVLLVALIGSILGPIIIELLKLRTDPRRKERQENEVRYYHLLRNLTGFIAGKENKEQIETFYEHYRITWLYAPDEVIKAINGFLISVGGAQKTPTEADKASRKMVFEVRKAFKGKTELNPEDFLIISIPE